MSEVGSRSRRSWLRSLVWLGAASTYAVALILEGHPWFLLIALGVAVALITVGRRRSLAAAVPGAAYATPADYVPGGARGGKFPGALSIMTTELVWNPSVSSTRKGILPVTLPVEDCSAIEMTAGSALFDAIVTVRGRAGGEWHFLALRSRRLRRAIGDLNRAMIH